MISIFAILRLEMWPTSVYDDLSCNTSQTFGKERVGEDSKALREAKLKKILKCGMK